MVEKLSYAGFKQIFDCKLIHIREETAKKSVDKAKRLLVQQPFKYSERISAEVADGIVHYGDRIIVNAELANEYDYYDDYDTELINYIGDHYSMLRDNCVLALKIRNSSLFTSNPNQQEVKFFQFVVSLLGEGCLENFTCKQLSSGNITDLSEIIVTFLNRNKHSTFSITIGILGEREEDLEGFSAGITHIENLLKTICDDDDTILQMVNLCTFIEKDHLKISYVGNSEDLHRYLVTR